jgi:hypothetical protein
MKKIFGLLSIASLMMIFTSCFDKIDNWYTETSSYDGRFVVSKTCEEYDDDNATIADGQELMIYNSAANVANEIIIDTRIAVNLADENPGFPVKGKLKVTGNSLEFKGDAAVDNISRTELSDDDYYIIFNGHYYLPSDLGSPDGLDEEYDAVQLYARLSVEEGKIIPGGATTIGGNISDKIYLETTMYFDYLIVESYETPNSTWADPAVPEYDWRVKAGSRTNADGWEEHWTLEGYRYTGFPEDIGATPPIITK